MESLFLSVALKGWVQEEMFKIIGFLCHKRKKDSSSNIIKGDLVDSQSLKKMNIV